jgi:hypothetical protein
MRRLEQLIGAWLGFAILLQAVLLAANTSMSRVQAVQFFAGAICLMLLVATLWRARFYFNPHADMLLIMFASGGFGMLLGMPLSHHMSHMVDFTIWRMCAGMLLFGFAPAVAFSRCLRAARQRGVLAVALLIDFSAMLAGMWLSTRVRIGPDEQLVFNRHLAMLGGMMLGMIAGMWIRSVFLLPVGSQTWRGLTDDTSEACLRTGRRR